MNSRKLNVIEFLGLSSRPDSPFGECVSLCSFRIFDASSKDQPNTRLATTLISRLMLNIRSPSLNYAPEDLKRSAISQLVFEIGVNTTHAHRQDKSEGMDYREREVELDVV